MNRTLDSGSRAVLHTTLVALSAAGLAANLVLALTPAPDVWQTLGTAARNAGLVAMGFAIVCPTSRRRSTRC